MLRAPPGYFCPPIEEAYPSSENPYESILDTLAPSLMAFGSYLADGAGDGCTGDFIDDDGVEGVWFCRVEL